MSLFSILEYNSYREIFSGFKVELFDANNIAQLTYKVISNDFPRIINREDNMSYNEILTQTKEIDDKYWLVRAIYNLGKVYDHNDQYSKALDYFTRSFEYSKDIGDNNNIYSSNGLRIGSNAQNVGNEWKGKISDVRIYNKVLSASEREALYRKTAARHDNDTLNVRQSSSVYPVDTRIYTSAKGITDTEGALITKPKTTRYENLVGWWKLDEGVGSNVIDSSGFLNIGEWYGSAAGDYRAPGWTNDPDLGTVMDFDGNDDYIECKPSNIGLSMKTVSIWINFDDITSTRIIHFASGKYIKIGSSSSINPEGLGTTIQYTDGIVSDPTISQSTWYHIAFTMTVAITLSDFSIGSSENDQVDGKMSDVRIYNSALNAEQIKVLYQQGGGNVRIGKGVMNSSVESEAFSGHMDDLRLYNRALTLDEIKGIWNSGSGSYTYLTPRRTTVAKYDFARGLGSTVYDSSGNNTNMQLRYLDVTSNTITSTSTTTPEYLGTNITSQPMWSSITKTGLHSLNFNEGKKDKSLILHYKFDNVDAVRIIDSSIYGNHGTTAGSMTTGDFVAMDKSGKNYGNALDFDGSNDHISITDTAGRFDGDGKRMTISLWFNPDAANVR